MKKIKTELEALQQNDSPEIRPKAFRQFSIFSINQPFSNGRDRKNAL